MTFEKDSFQGVKLSVEIVVDSPGRFKNNCVLHSFTPITLARL